MTVIGYVTKQPVLDNVYVITAEPAAMPVTKPDASIVATDKLLELQLPDGDASVRWATWPIHTAIGLEIGDGNELTVSVLEALQPVAVMM